MSEVHSIQCKVRKDCNVMFTSGNRRFVEEKKSRQILKGTVWLFRVLQRVDQLFQIVILNIRSAWDVAWRAMSCVFYAVKRVKKKLPEVFSDSSGHYITPKPGSDLGPWN